MRKNTDKANELIRQLASVYRYVLKKKSTQLVVINEEINATQNMIELFNKLPHCKLDLEVKHNLQGHVLPGSIMYIVEKIYRTSISDTAERISISIYGKEDFLNLRYITQDRLINRFKESEIKSVSESYQKYSDHPVSIVENNNERIIQLPMLQIEVQ
jgi:LytS/YehU family sensor histidine kinase